MATRAEILHIELRDAGIPATGIATVGRNLAIRSTSRPLTPDEQTTADAIVAAINARWLTDDPIPIEDARSHATERDRRRQADAIDDDPAVYLVMAARQLPATATADELRTMAKELRQADAVSVGGPR